MKCFPKRLQNLFPVLIFCFSVLSSMAQEKVDSISHASKKRATKMALMSAVVPGLGQIGNKKYWKLPILYGASGALYYFIKTNNTEYLKFKHALINKTDNDSLTTDNYPRFTVEDLTVRKDYYRRNRDLSYILATVLYALNIIDAYVDSQLMNFDVGDNLSLHTGGTIIDIHGSSVACLQLMLTFK